MQAFWTEAAKEFMTFKVDPDDFNRPAERWKQWRDMLSSKVGHNVDLSSLDGFKHSDQFNARHWKEPKFAKKQQRQNFRDRRCRRSDSSEPGTRAKLIGAMQASAPLVRVPPADTDILLLDWLEELRMQDEGTLTANGPVQSPTRQQRQDKGSTQGQHLSLEPIA